MAPVVIVPQPHGRFFVNILGTNLLVDTDASVVEQTFTQLLAETTQNLEAIPGYANPRSIVGLKVTYAGATDHPLPAVLQLCIGCRCVLLPLLHNQHIPKTLAILLAYSSFLKIIGLTVPTNASFFGWRPVRCEDPWTIASERRGNQAFMLGTFDRLAGWVLEADIERPPMVEGSADASWEQWPPTGSRLANLCMDVFLLRQVGRRLLLEEG